MKAVGFSLAVIVLATLAWAAAGLAWAHHQIDRIDPALPEVDAVLAHDPDADLPIRIRYLNTASQSMPRAAVLEPSLDPHPERPYVMSHASFALEWSDGRLFLIDLGMDRDAARTFGRPLEWLSGANAIEPRGPVAEQLGGAVQRIDGLGFTHLHVDHTQGIAALCARRAAGAPRLPIFQTGLQAQETNYTTRPARAQIDAAPCTLPRKLTGGPLVPIPGFAGLAVMAAAGHTPGSQIFVAHVRGALGVVTWVFTGDAVNHADGVALDLPKPRLYSRFVVPESAARLARVRRFLAALAASHDTALLVSHDQHQIEASGVAAW